MPRERGRVVVPAGDERGPRRAAQGGGVEAVVPQALGRELVHRRRRDAAAERAELAEAGVVEQDQHDVRRALGRLHRLRELRLVGVEVGPADVAGEMEVGPGQHARRAAGLGRCRVGFLVLGESDG